MKIGIIGAIKEEIYNFKNIIKNCKQHIIGHCLIYTGTINQFNIILIKSGIGKVSASISTMILINIYKPNFIINNGSAGSLKALLKIGEIIIPQKMCYYDVDLVNFGYSIGQIPGLPKQFNNNQILSQILKKTAITLKLKILKGNLISGDSFIRQKNIIKILQSKFSSAIAVDMESAAIAQVCYQFKIPLIVIKYISDLSDSNATENFQKNVYTASISSFNLIKNMLENFSPLTLLDNLCQKQ